MRDNRLTNMKWRAEASKLSHPAARLIARLISEKTNHVTFMADEEFPLPWSKVRDWLRLAEDQCYHYLRELLVEKYLFHAGKRGCPGTNFYKFNFSPSDCRESSSRIFPGTGSRNNPGTRYGKNSGTSSRAEAGHHISNSLREESIAKEAGKRGAAAAAKKVVRATPEGDEVLTRRPGETVAEFQKRCREHHGLN